jgi:hypothetical protein
LGAETLYFQAHWNSLDSFPFSFADDSPEVAIVGVGWDAYIALEGFLVAGYRVTSLWAHDDDTAKKWATLWNIPHCKNTLFDLCIPNSFFKTQYAMWIL